MNMFNDLGNGNKENELWSFQGYLISYYGMYTSEVLNGQSYTIVLCLFKC